MTAIIVDSHTHLGSGRVFESNVGNKELISAMDEHGVAASLVMPYPGTDDTAGVHDQIKELAEEHPGRIYGIVNHSPHDQGFEDEARRCITELGFVALKLHTIGHAVNPLSESGNRVFSTAATLGVPVIVHTGPGIPFSLPSLCLPLARKFRDTSVVLAHAGHALLNAEAIVVASELPNVYLETSWNHFRQIRTAVRQLGAERVMLGSDGPWNLGITIEQHRAADLTSEEWEHVVAGTARKVFSLGDQPS